MDISIRIRATRMVLRLQFAGCRFAIYPRSFASDKHSARLKLPFIACNSASSSAIVCGTWSMADKVKH